MANALRPVLGDVLLLGGYKGHGKDTFFDFLTGTRQDVDFEVTVEDSQCTLPKLAYTRLAFADVLKQQVAKLLNVSVEYIDAHKDLPIDEKLNYVPYDTNNVIKTLRDVLIDYATHKRKTDQYYFTRFVCDQIKHIEDSVIVITDFRFVEEYMYLCVGLPPGRTLFTARVHNSNAPIPGKEEASEHQLDGFYFHYLVKNK